ncbi:MAG: cell division protein [Oceanospirillaceae bacterium]|nr:cell division protein [Oceanospirillaceae bacterium]
MLVIALIALGVTVRLTWLHTVEQPFLYSEGQKRTVRVKSEPARRGVITDRFGQPLAVSTSVVDIGIHPNQIDPSVLPDLASALGRNANDLIRTVAEARLKKKSFIYLARQVQPDVADRVAALEVEGIQLNENFRRYYPAGEVTADLVGLVDIDHNGQEGIELAYDSYLEGQEGKRTVVQDRKENVVKLVGVSSVAKPGKDIALTIDLRLQYLTYRELKAAVEQHSAFSGSAVLLDAHTGEVLAMASQPSYNPNNRALLKAENMRNRAVADVIEPGSTMKPFTVAAALESGRYKPESMVDTDPGFMKVKHKTIRDHRNYGQLDVTGVITKSSNVGVTLLSADLGADTMWQFFTKAGLGQPSGLGFPGETVGQLPYPDQLDPLRLATVSYGYGLATSPLQLAQAYTSFTQNGCRMSVSIVMDSYSPEDCQPVMKPQVAKQMLNILETVTSSKGTGRRARVDGYRVGGKTGTAHRIGRYGYEEAKYTAVFAGVAPISNPEVVLVVVIDDPKGREYYGGEVAAPVFSRIVSQALRLRQVPPDDMPDVGQQVAGGVTWMD